MTIALHHGDMLSVIPRLVAEGVACDACVTDAPYHLSEVPHVAPGGFGGKRPGERKRARAGFMGQQWDGGDIAFRPETWATIATILRPGGFLVAFGGTRTSHRLACAIEDAGFVIQDSILDLIATDARVQRFVATLSPAQVDAFSHVLDDMQPTGALAWMFATGFPKRRDMLKPAFEPIVLAYKPGGKRTMQVDECRIATDEIGKPKKSPSVSPNGWGMPGACTGGGANSPLGRWPANICHDSSDEVMACFPESNGQAANLTGLEPSSKTNNVYGQFKSRSATITHGDSGSAARFFFSAKAGAEDRWGSRHPTVKPVDLIAWLVTLVTPPGGTFLDPFAGSGTAAVAALKTGRNAILIEREAGYVADIRERIAFYEGGGQHSTQAKNRNRKVDHGPLFEAQGAAR